MKKVTQLIILSFFGLFFASVAHAETIKDFNSKITVLPDSSIFVEENITYNFEESIRHGIYRTIPLLNSKNESTKIEVVSVLDDNKNPYEFTTDTEDGTFTIKIGSLDKMVSGTKIFNITYRVLGSIAYYDGFDEIYWNVTGNDWDIPIKKSEARVVLPINVFPLNQDCYYGPSGGKTKCKITEDGIFSSGTILNKNEGLTVAVSFPKGAVTVYQPEVDSALVKFAKTFWPAIIPLIVFVFAFIKWLKVGRDPKGKNVIIPQYDVPDNLTPLEVGGIINEKVKNQNISAEIIYLATKGFIKIKQVDKVEYGLIPQKDYEFTLLKEEGLLPNSFDKKILTAIFENKGKVGGTSVLSSLKNNFYTAIKDIDNSVIDMLLNKKYYTNFPKIRLQFGVILLVFWLTFMSLSSGLFGDSTKSSMFNIVFILSAISSIIIFVIFNHLMPAKSEKGVSTKEYLLGLKDYLQIAEKDRLHFHNAPDKKPEIFEKLLPYAMIFGVEELWAKEFKDIYKGSPVWYEGGSSKFDIVSFGHEMAIFSTLSSTSFSASPSGSGSGGGGFSGGGGGGGGGGSW